MCPAQEVMVILVIFMLIQIDLAMNCHYVHINHFSSSECFTNNYVSQNLSQVL